MSKGTNIDYPTGNVTLENGSRVLWSKLQRHRRGLPRGVPTICGECGIEHLAVPSHAIKPGFTGLCANCFHKSHTTTGIEYIGDKGSFIDHDRKDPEDPRKRVFTCGACKGEWSAFPRSRRDRAKLVDLCPRCKPRKFTGRVTLRKGTVVDFDDRVGSVTTSGTYYKVAIECRGCFAETGEKKYVSFSRIRGYIEGRDKKQWSEQCGACANAPSAKRRLTGQRIAKSGTITDFERVSENDEVPTIYSLCGCVLWKAWRDGVTNWKSRPDSCPDHNNPKARAENLAKRMIEETASLFTDGAGQGSGKAGDSGPFKRGGRPRKFTDDEAFEAIDTVVPRVSVSALAVALGCSRPTVNDWAHEKGYLTLAELVTARRSARPGV